MTHTESLFALIMAGGAGTRFWPESRVGRPKQLLTFGKEKTLLESTVARLEGLVPSDQRWILTNERLVPAVQSLLGKDNAVRVIGEPAKRDTAPCIGLAAALIANRNSKAIMVVTPSDHVIGPNASFVNAVRRACELVEQDPTRFVTFGIRPTYPATTFGYIERRTSPLDARDPKSFSVKRFREKPDEATAREYLATGAFYWNAGIFVWRVDSLLLALEKFEPEISRPIQRIAVAEGQPDFDQVFRSEFSAIRGKSIDYAIMERYDNVVVVEAPFDWDDVGSWQSLSRIHGADDQGNTIVGKHIGVRTSRSIVQTSEDHLVATLGVSDCVVVHTSDATLVCNRHDEEAVRELVKILEERGWRKYLE